MKALKMCENFSIPIPSMYVYGDEENGLNLMLSLSRYHVCFMFFLTR